MKRITLTMAALLTGGMILYSQPVKSGMESGETIFKQRCGGCHGLDGKAQTTIGKNLKMRDLTSPEVQKQSDSEFIRTIANGQGRMPAYQLILGDDGIKAVVGYIREIGNQ
jgi:mono/diheme cytochrome c family protein